MKKSIERVVGRISDLPTLPRTVLRITELVNNPKSSARDLARVVSEDQVLTARLLKLVNSSFYGFPQKISTVAGAVVLVGFDAIRNLLLTTSIFDLFSKKRINPMILERFWDHSLGCAICAKIIGQRLRYERMEELFVSGLLHDIGKIVVMLYLNPELEKILALVKSENLLIREAEERVLGCTHAEIGRLLADRWNLSPKLAEVIAFHHEPRKSERFHLEAGIVHLSDILCRAVDIGSGGDPFIPALDRGTWELLNLGVDSLDPILEKMEKELEDIRSFIRK
jgi:HD-like signal output (HDOD) protein